MRRYRESGQDSDQMPKIGVEGKVGLPQTIENILTAIIIQGQIGTSKTIPVSLISSEENLRTVVDMILKEVCTSTKNDFQLKNLAKFCKANYDITVLSEDKTTTTLKKVLINKIVKSFDKFINLKYNIRQLTRNYKGPEEKKEKWIDRCYTEYFPPLQRTVYIYAKFIYYLLLEQMFSTTCILTIMTNLSKMKQTHSLELLYELLKNTGKHLEVCASISSTTEEEYNKLFNQMSACLQNQNENGLPENSRKILRDLIQLKENNWLPGRRKLYDWL